jgi:hypothetical protein
MAGSASRSACRAVRGLPQPQEHVLGVHGGLEVAESTAKLLVGHKRVSMTYGHYSKGQRVNLRAALDKLDYGSTIMSAI